MTTARHPHALYQKTPGNGPFYLPIRRNGKVLVKSTGTSDLNAAIRKVPELLARAHTEMASPVPASKVWTIGQAFDEMIATKIRAEAPTNTIRNYQSARSMLTEAISPGTKLTELSREHVNAFVDLQVEKQRKRSTTRGYLILLMTVLRHAIVAKHYAGDLVGLIPKEIMAKPAPRKRFLSEQECVQLLAAAQPHHRDYILAYLYTGCRKTELFAICPEHVDLSANTIRIPGKKTDTSDGTIAIAAPLRPVIEARVSQTNFGEPLFPRLVDINKSISRAATNAGLAHLTCHDLRRTTGSMLASKNVSLQIIAKVLRQKDIATTSRTYAHLYPDATGVALANLPVFASAPLSDVRKTKASRTVVQVDKATGAHLATFPNLTEAARATGIASNKIGDVAAGRSKSAGGFRWVYLVA